MIYVIHAIMFILSNGNQIQIGFGFLKVNVFDHVMFGTINNVLFYRYHTKKRECLKNISYVCYDAGGEYLLSVSIITHFIQGENTYL